ncbi:AsnC family transcriptional regulator [Candidatus Woesearchaeota archaeon]|nr:AsnC family transcriptional regulator [Candidatus Woesearchaeota archaeon]
MDKKDRRILHELTKNARIPLKQLAKKIKMSQSATLYRINRLEKEKVLLSSFTLINTYKLGYQGFRAYLRLFGTVEEKEKEILAWLQGRKEISVIGIEQDPGAIVIMSWVDSAEAYFKFAQDLKQKYGEFLEQFHIFPYMGTIHYPRNYLNPQDKGEEKYVRYSTEVKHDELDISILRLLSYDGRISAMEIAKRLKKPTKTIVNRIKNLEKQKIIAGYSINIDIGKLGYQYYKLNIIFSKCINQSTLLSYAKQLLNTVYVDEAMGRYDFELNVEVRDKDELNSIINDLKNLSGGIRSMEIKQLQTYIKIGFIS